MTEFLTTGQAAKLLGVHINTIRRATNSGKLSYQRFGGNGKSRHWRRISLENLEKYAGRELTTKGVGQNTGDTQK